MFRSRLCRRGQYGRRRLSLQPLESRRVLAASLGWDGPGLGSTELTYTIGNAPSSLSQSEVDSAIATAFDAWAGVANITFTQVDQARLRNSIDISFQSIDGPGGTLAQGYSPDDVNPARIAGDIQFDLAEVWEVGNSLGNQAIDLVWVAAHEIGHSLGLDHLGDLGSVMQEHVSPNEFFTGLTASDVAAIQGLYAAADGNVTAETLVEEMPVDDSLDTDTGEPDRGDSDGDPSPRKRWRGGGDWGRRGDRGGPSATHTPKHHLDEPTDTNDDGTTSALDALTIINQLNATAESSTGYCDVNGDGNVSALDALTVINSLRVSSHATVSATEIQAELESTEMENTELENTEADTSDRQTIDDSETVAEADEERVDDGLPTDEPMDSVDESDESNDEETAIPVDDGGMPADEESNCESDHHDGFGHGRFAARHGRVVGGMSDALFTRFDTNEDGSLTKGELPEGLWEHLIDKGIDADSDGSITPEEIERHKEMKQAERFAEKDDNGDGLLSEDEVSSRLWEKISSADSDGDSSVSLEEFETWLEQRSEDTPQTEDFSPPMRGFDRAFAQLGRRFGHGRR